MWGRFEDGELVAACHVGANLVPGRGDAGRRPAPSPSGRWPAAARVSTIVGPQDAVEVVLERRRGRAGAGRGSRAGTSRTSRSTTTPPVAPDPDGAPDHAATTSTCSTRRASRCTPRRSASRPEDGGGAELYRARVSQLISRGWSFARIEDGRRGVQGRGRLRDAVRRPDPGRLGAARPPRARGWPPPGWPRWSSWSRREIAPVVSLYVNDWNEPARRAYERVGFQRDGHASRRSCSDSVVERTVTA